MKYTCVTSMHRPYFDHIGSVMIESWLKYWIGDAQLIVYAEGFSENYNNDRISFIDWNERCEKNFNHYTTLTKGPSLTFAKKGMAFLDAMKSADCDRLVWLDADLLFLNTIPLEKFDNILPDEKLIALFDQYYNINSKYSIEEYTNKDLRTVYGAESGFVFLNPKHQNYKSYVKNYNDLYLNKKHPLITNWYDSELVVLAARDHLNDIVDLSQLRTTNKTQTPLNRCWISKFVSHQKAKSKHQYSVDDLRKLCGLKT